MSTTAEKTKIKNDLLIRAINHETVERPPVWMMRQAGRYLPEYMAIRKEFSFLDLCKNAEKAAEVSIQPLEIVGVDAIIMFSDILIPLEPMGAAVSFATGSPKFAEPIRTKEQVEKLIVPDVLKECSFVYDVIDEIKKQITKDGLQEVPILGFAGAPWTLASYMIEGGGSQHYDKIKGFMYQEPEAMHQLLDKLVDTISPYLIAKLDRGVSMVQLFDTWASQLSQEDYLEFALPYQQKIIKNIRAKYPDAKIALYINGVANIFDYMLQSGADVLSIDWRVDIGDIREKVLQHNEWIDENGEMDGQMRKITIQGNLDPCKLLGTKESVVKAAENMLEEAGPEPGYIANLGHGIIPSVPVENAKTFINTVKNYKY